MAVREWQLEVTATARPSGIRLRGEVDIFTLPTLELALELLVGRAGDATVDLRELTFIDVIGLRALARAAIQLRSLGRCLRLSGASVQIRRILGLLGWVKLFELPADPPARRLHASADRGTSARSMIHPEETCPAEVRAR